MFDSRWMDRWKEEREGGSKGKKRRQADCIDYFKSKLDKSEPNIFPSSQNLLSSSLYLFSTVTVSYSQAQNVSLVLLFLLQPLYKVSHLETHPIFFHRMSKSVYLLLLLCTSSLEFVPKLFSNLPI